jgi:hypothetical protein
VKNSIAATTLVLFVAIGLTPTHSRAEEVHAATGQLLDWETPDAWGGKAPADSGGATFVIGQQAQVGPLPLPKSHYIVSVWKGGDVRLDPGGELRLSRPIRFPKDTKLILNGGTIVTEGARPVGIYGDIEVAADTTVSLQGDNVLELRGGLTKNAKLLFERPSDASRVIDFQGDLSQFGGTLQFSGNFTVRFRRGDWGSGTVIFDSVNSRYALVMSEDGFKTRGKLELGNARLDLQNNHNEMGGLSANNLAVDAGAYSDFTQLVPGGNASDVPRFFLNTENASIKVGP